MSNAINVDLDPALASALESRALLRGVSVEDEVREILHHAVREAPMTEYGLGTRMAARFEGIGLDEPLPEIRKALTDRFPLWRPVAGKPAPTKARSRARSGGLLSRHTR